jgi:hypothetical protein
LGIGSEREILDSELIDSQKWDAAFAFFVSLLDSPSSFEIFQLKIQR